MPLRKTTISLSEELLAAVDRAARARRESRNRFVVRVLHEAVQTHLDLEVTRRLNALLADPELARDQGSAAADLDAAGTDWRDERW
jgi:hypothetical protein